MTKRGKSSKLRTLETVRSCPAVRFSYECPKQWSALAETDDPDVRHCSACEEPVYLCRTDEETIARATAGQCVARSEPHPDEFPPVSLVVGRVMVTDRPVEPTAPPEAVEWRARERAIGRSLESEKLADDRRCPSCAFPIPDWRSRCFVCST